MESEARYTTIGAVVVALVIALVAAIVWLKQVGAERDFRYYTIYFSQQALDGLQIGGDVDVRGIKVGRVEDYALTDGAQRVRVTVRLDRRAPIYANTVAVVTRNLVTGIAGITLVTPEPPGELLTQAPAGEPLPVIAEGRSNLDRITGRVQQLGEMAGEALTNFNALLDASNRNALTATIGNLRDFTAGLNARLTALDETLAAMAQAASDVRGASQRVTAVADEFNRDLGPTLEEARRALAEVGRAAAAVQAGGKRLDGAVASIDDQLSAALIDLRVTLDNANRTLDRLSDVGQSFAAPNRANLGPGEKAP
ncbi:MAG: MlaD family protein [Burkholderiales bacterium]|jgi:phospholipid/cholesterol/gamma-HCH transport system substrate-binding protein|nr:MlaD family protein [Burkholderiales bacterium]